VAVIRPLEADTGIPARVLHPKIYHALETQFSLLLGQSFLLVGKIGNIVKMEKIFAIANNTDHFGKSMCVFGDFGSC
jgi:hypothetical protein